MRALAAAHDEQRAFFRAFVQPEKRLRLRLVEPFAQAGADRRAGHFGARLRKKFRAFLEPEQHRFGEARVEPVGLAGDGVGLVDERRQFHQPPREHRRGRGESAHAEHGVRPEIAVERAAPRNAHRKAAHETEHRGRKKPRHPDGGQFLKTEHPGVVAHGQRVDLLLGDEDQDGWPR